MPRSRSPVGLLSLLLVVSAALAADNPAPSFAKDVRRLLEAKCARCHGEKVKRADLDLSTPAAVLKGGESGPVVVPGQANATGDALMVRYADDFVLGFENRSRRPR